MKTQKILKPQKPIELPIFIAYFLDGPVLYTTKRSPERLEITERGDYSYVVFTPRAVDWSGLDEAPAIPNPDDEEE